VGVLDREPIDFNSHFDVAVIGGGPGGSAVAKRCAESGLRTLLLEKHKLPRNKVCTGMIMSEMAQTLIKKEFGSPPDEVLTTPPYLLGFKFRAPGARTLTLERRMPFAWRRDFDYWLNRVVEGVGVKLYDEARVKSVVEAEGSYLLSLDKDGEIKHIRARFLIGADGTLSIIRMACPP